MAQPQFVVVELRVDASNAQQGAASYSAALDKAQRAAEALTSSADKAQLAITKQSTAMTQAAAANDNLAKGYSAANDNFQQFGKSLGERAIDFLNNINHLKLMAVAAYAISPAFRSFTNTEISAGLKLIGVNMNLVAAAAGSVASFLAPALAFLSRITIPIVIAVAAWKALNYVIELGSGLLDKYANSQRALFASDVSDNLTKLTKFQTDAITPQQVQYATELGNRLAEAKKEINDFFGVTIDATGAALRLQNAWVVILEAIGRALTLIGQIPSAMATAANSIGSSSIWDKLNFGWQLPGAMTQQQFLAQQGQGGGDQTAQALARARQQLAAGLGVANIGKDGAPIGGSFAARFSQDVNALSNVDNKEKDKYSTNAYDRAVQSIRDQVDQLKLEADGANKTSQAYQELKVAHELNIAAMKAGIKPTDDMREEWKKLADQIADYNIKVNQTKVLNEETFKGATMFMSPAQAAAATAAHQIDPTNWTAHLEDAGPKMAAFNAQIGQARDLTVDFTSGFEQGMLRGQTAIQAAQSALLNLENQLIQMINKNLVNSLFGGGVGGGSGGGLGGIFASLFGGKAGTGAPVNIVGGAGSLPVPTFADGGVIPAGGLALVSEHGPGGGRFVRAGNEPIMVTPNNVGGGNANVQVNIINNANGTQVQQQQRNEGGMNITDVIISTVNDGMANGKFDGVLRARHGLALQPRPR